MNDFLFEKETYIIIGFCMEVHRVLGHGFSEIVYKDALVIEALQNGILFEREKVFQIEYKQSLLKHSFCSDFLFFDEIIVEIKASENAINDNWISQTLNYIKASNRKVGLLINFGKKSLEHKRLII
jgi:GxxExxY protein